MNTPLEKALLTLRPDLTLQIARGGRAQDVQLDVAGAYGLAIALLATLCDLAPWVGRTDAEIMQRVHELASSAVRMFEISLRRGPIARESEDLIMPSLNAAFSILALLADEQEKPHA